MPTPAQCNLQLRIVTKLLESGASPAHPTVADFQAPATLEFNPDSSCTDKLRASPSGDEAESASHRLRGQQLAAEHKRRKGRQDCKAFYAPIAKGTTPLELLRVAVASRPEPEPEPEPTPPTSQRMSKEATTANLTATNCNTGSILP